ncbi:MAG TPA: hypothetical protein ENG14_04320 [Thermodesulforhabdus norvegica]|uniref:Uncharacterized protein n=1 Tax=Thermodesulforhabdus norvegica TaxID=39841 RepID=A0A7C0WS75_9BACT|nr:hypothetical protein [Thermodesulforhabdus norvegica]
MKQSPESYEHLRIHKEALGAMKVSRKKQKDFPFKDITHKEKIESLNKLLNEQQEPMEESSLVRYDLMDGDKAAKDLFWNRLWVVLVFLFFMCALTGGAIFFVYTTIDAVTACITN